MGILVRLVLLICHLATAQADTCSYEVSLPARYSYQEVPLPSVNRSTSLVAEVKACKDAHLAISNSRDLSKDMFELVFGAGNNTFCAIRTCKQSCRIATFTGSTLSCKDFRKLWIAWGSPGVRIGLGSDVDENTLMTTTSGASLAVHHLWITMYYGENGGDWKINCTYNKTSTSTKPVEETSTVTSTPTAQRVTTTNIPISSDQLTTSRTPDTTESTMIGPRTSLDMTTTSVNTKPWKTGKSNTRITAETTTSCEDSDMSKLTSVSARESVTFATDVTMQETTATRMENSATTPTVSSPSPDVPRCCCEQVRPSSTLTRDKIMDELTLIEQTSARRRRLESASDNRASAQFLGLTAVAVLVTVTLIVIVPDLIALFVWTAVKLHLFKKTHDLSLVLTTGSDYKSRASSF